MVNEVIVVVVVVLLMFGVLMSVLMLLNLSGKL